MSDLVIAAFDLADYIERVYCDARRAEQLRSLACSFVALFFHPITP